ncbi:L-threonylcarbamoyladenylate synthase [Parerythrobacter jejuensis]|uniref:Threonylcarbamoyl-AMP synthase n=1 Tax=Parerythrobacter jejuensis TaxID=795812 RepID=A0A845AVT9_9SPHN|nr:L-threonylcarbamoyladenylate synthase [Parerythrobacter jejuensis]MXP30928.1 threonylcarbamoyl-AMP synthase [Parerythrobacter jejuensis]MXP33688.1 threonylcarbamoyl-AMP synthase [Parerythrobacter jejuensis]
MGGKNATEVLRADAAGIAQAARILNAGGLVAVPTETVYGLAARADRADAVAAIYAAKGRPDFNPLIVHVADLEQAERLVDMDERAAGLVRRFWPGPLTMVLPVRPDSGLAKAVTAGLPTLAVRMPAHPTMRAVLAQTEAPLAAPSANASETVSPTCPDHVLKTLRGRIDAVLDGGASADGLESTIVALRDDGTWNLLRPGPIEEGELSEILGPCENAMTSSIEAPGQLARHYAPGKPVRLNATSASSDEFHIGFGDVAGDWSLSPEGSLTEAAARLYAGLHRGAESVRARIAIAPIPDDGLGAAINDRLRRAAA